MLNRMKKCGAIVVSASMLITQSLGAFAMEYEPGAEDELIISEDLSAPVETDNVEIIVDDEGDVEAEEEIVTGEVDSVGAFIETEEAATEFATDYDDESAPRYILSEDEREFKENVRVHAELSNIAALEEGTDYVSKEVIALADSQEQAEKIAAAYGGTLKRYLYGVATISLDGSSYSVEEAYFTGMDEDSDLPAVEPNYIRYLIDPVSDEEEFYNHTYSFFDVPDDNGFENSYYGMGLNDPALNPGNSGSDAYQWFHGMIESYSAWGVTTGDPGITVAVIDTGVMDTHVELAGKVVPADIDFGNGLAHNQDMSGHGTHVAGIIAAKGKNGVGGAGVAPDVTILAVNANHEENGRYGSFYTDDEIAAINYVAGNSAADRKADIINMSLGGSSYIAAEQEVIDKAYRNGVTIVAAMGNERANNISYPAAYNHVIGVASVNQSGEKSNFSTYGSWCDISAPGSGIYSTYNDGGYDSLDGTSMATPVVAGACALYMSAYGHVDPDIMEKVLKKSATKASGTGLGAGIVNVAKMFGADTNAPTITLKNGSSVIGSASSKAVTIKGNQKADCSITFSPNNFDKEDESNKNTYIVYTTDGSKPVVSNGTVVNGSAWNYEEWSDLSVSVKDLVGTVEKKMTITVKAVAVTGIGAVSKVASLKFTVEPTGTTTLVSTITITGQNNIAAGTKATYKATVLPSKAKNKKVTWSVDSASEAKGIAIIPNKGTLTVPATVESGFEIMVTATSMDDSGVDAVFPVTVTSAKVNTVMIKAAGATYYYNKISEKKGSLTSATLFNVNIDKEGFESAENEIKLTAVFTDKSENNITGAESVWTSSNPKVAVVSEDGTGWKVTAVNKGTANITCTAQDGSKKKATLKVNVVVPASGLSLTIKGGQTSYVAVGKSVTTLANVGNAYGKPTNSKVNWDCRVLGLRSNHTSDYLSSSIVDGLKRYKAFKFSNGKLSVGSDSNISKAFYHYLPSEYEDIIFEITATTADGTGYTATKAYRMEPIATYMYLDCDGDRVTTQEYYPENYENEYYFDIKTDGYDPFEVTCSNPKVASAYCYGRRIYITPHARGKATLKIKTNNGSGKTFSFKVKVN